MKYIEHIVKNEDTIAIIIRNSFNPKGLKFVTKDKDPFQVGVMCYDKEHVIKPHLHKPVSHKVNCVSEVLYVAKGKLKATFYDNKKEIVCHKIVSVGDALLLFKGGHGFKVLKGPCKVVEVKQGPYTGREHDKTHFD